MNDTFEEADEGGLGAGGIGVAELPRVDADTETTPPGEEVAPSDSAGGDVDADVEAHVDRQVDRTVGESSVRLVAIAVVIVLVGAGAGLIGSFLIPKEYAARAEITYHLMESQPNELLREDRRLTTQLVLLGSRVVLPPRSPTSTPWRPKIWSTTSPPKSSTTARSFRWRYAPAARTQPERC